MGGLRERQRERERERERDNRVLEKRLRPFSVASLFWFANVLRAFAMSDGESSTSRGGERSLRGMRRALQDEGGGSQYSLPRSVGRSTAESATSKRRSREKEESACIPCSQRIILRIATCDACGIESNARRPTKNKTRKTCKTPTRQKKQNNNIATKQKRNPVQSGPLSSSDPDNLKYYVNWGYGTLESPGGSCCTLCINNFTMANWDAQHACMKTLCAALKATGELLHDCFVVDLCCLFIVVLFLTSCCF